MNITINGLDGILQNLMQLNVHEELENKVVNKAAKVAQESIQNEAPVDDGTLQKNIKIRRAKNGEAVIHTGAAFHAHLVEFGRSGGSVVTKKGRKVTWGPTVPNPFFTRGFNSSEAEAKQVMVDELKKGLKLL